MKVKAKKIRKRLNSKGFSFIEAMLSMAVMTVGIIAALQLFSSGTAQSMESRDQTIGAMLAQEGAEVVQNIRDNNWAARNTRPAFDNLPTASAETDNCRVSYLSTSMTDAVCGSELSDKSLYLSVSNYYVLDSGTLTKFKRKIIIKYYDALGSLVVNSLAQKAEVTSVVVWGDENFPSGTDINSDNCGTANNCSYSKTLLSKWAE